MINTSGLGPSSGDRPKIPNTLSTTDIPLSYVLLRVQEISLEGEHPKVRLLFPDNRAPLALTMGDHGVSDLFWSQIKAGDQILVPVRDSSVPGQAILDFRYVLKFKED